MRGRRNKENKGKTSSVEEEGQDQIELGLQGTSQSNLKNKIKSRAAMCQIIRNVVEEDKIQNPKQEQKIQSELQVISVLRKKVSDGLRNALKKNEISQKLIDQDAVKKMKSRRARWMIKKADPPKGEGRICQICEGEIPIADQWENIYLCDCQHKKDYCSSCLYSYVIYKLKSFEMVLCPDEDCHSQMQEKTTFFQKLPSNLQKRYKKVSNFFKTTEDPNIKLCPTSNCEGLLKLRADKETRCAKCKYSFCSKCLLKAHEGQCEMFELDYLQENLQFRQCKQCKIVIERTGGCNHMVCVCKYQFCYVCGLKWSNIHYQDHTINDIPQSQPETRQHVIQPSRVRNNISANQNSCCCSAPCSCSQCQSMIKAFFKGILFILLFTTLLMPWVITTLFLVVIVLILTFFIGGIYQFKNQFQNQSESPINFKISISKVALIVFFPIFLILLMVIGVKKHFTQQFGCCMEKVNNVVKIIGNAFVSL